MQQFIREFIVTRAYRIHLVQTQTKVRRCFIPTGWKNGSCQSCKHTGSSLNLVLLFTESSRLHGHTTRNSFPILPLRQRANDFKKRRRRGSRLSTNRHCKVLDSRGTQVRTNLQRKDEKLSTELIEKDVWSPGVRISLCLVPGLHPNTQQFRKMLISPPDSRGQ
jgi:hypothetical protein